MPRHPLLWILLAALALRIVAAFALQAYLDRQHRPFLIMGDAEGYWELGRRIAHGETFQLYDPPRRAERMPGYPAFIAVAVRISEALRVPQHQYFIARLMMAVVGTACCWLVARLGVELFDERVGIIAATIAAAAPPLVAFSVILLSETLFAAALLLSLWCLAKLVRVMRGSLPLKISVAWSVIAGVSIALAVYVRPSWLLVSPVFACVLLVSKIGDRPFRERALVAGLLVAATYVALVPWAMRNWRVTGHWVTTTLWVGPSLYDGFHPQATGDSDMRFFERDRLLDRMSEFDMDREYRSRAWRFIVENPRRAFELTAIKLARYWKPWPNADQFAGLGLKLAIAGYFLPVLLLAAYAWLAGRFDRWSWLLTIGPILYFSAIHAVFLGSLRYRLPVEYPLCIAAAVGARQFLGKSTRPPATGATPS